MNIFTFLIYLGILNIIFGFIWKWIFVLPVALLFTLIKLDRAMIIVKAFGAYLLISLTAFFTLIAIEDGSGWKLLFFPLVGAFVLFMGFAQNIYEQRKQASINYDYALMEQIARNEKYDLVITFGSIFLYALILFFPTVGINPINGLILKIIQWIYEFPIIGFLIGIGGFFFMLSFIWYGIIMLLALIGSAYNKLEGKTNENYSENNTNDAEIINSKHEAKENEVLNDNEVDDFWDNEDLSDAKIEEPFQKDDLKESIHKKEKSLNEFIDKTEQLKIELTMIKQEYEVKIGRLYLKLDEIDLEILKFKKIEDLVNKGSSIKEAQTEVERIFNKRREQIKEEHKKLDEEEKDIENRRNISKEEKEELKKLWRKLAHKYHPDKATGNEDMMKKINKAYAENDLDTLKAIDRNEISVDIEAETAETLKNRLAGLDIAIVKIKQEFKQLKHSEWFILKENIEKAKKQKRDMLKELENKILTDIAEKENQLGELRKKYGK
ncbi:MAG: DnaJ domain-containing protein [Candidatus Moranbacteria bacterium]|nr:DnaJ domain-containing protein [Candidatus Moranbacteria bacterium]